MILSERSKLLLLCLLVLALHSPAAAPSRADDPAAEPGVGEPRSLDKLVLVDLMYELDEAFGPMRRAVRDPEQAETALELLSRMQLIVIHAKVKSPPLDGIPAEQAAADVQAFRLRMLQLLSHLLEAERAVLQGRAEDAFEQVKKMMVVKREGHKKFGVY